MNGVAFRPGMPASILPCPACGAKPNEPCLSHRLGLVRATLHHGRVLGARKDES